MKTLSEWARLDNVPVRTAQAHRQRVGVGTLHGRAWVLTAREWRTVLNSIKNTKRGNPMWRKK